MRMPAICDACVHKGQETGEREDSPPACTAFKGGIPLDIWEGEFDHRDPHKDDHGVRFVLKPGERDVLELWESLR